MNRCMLQYRDEDLCREAPLHDRTTAMPLGRAAPPDVPCSTSPRDPNLCERVDADDLGEGSETVSSVAFHGAALLAHCRAALV